MFTSRLSLGNLIELCRVLRHYLQSGLSLVEAFRKQAKTGASGVRPVAGRILAKLEKGDSLEEALKAEKAVFPPLFVTLAGVGEKTGNLPEVIAELEKYYLFRKKLWNQFIGMIAWPVLQFNAAIFVLAGLIFMMGFVAEMTGSHQPLDPLGLGLSGFGGALIFLGAAYGSLVGLYVVYLLVTRLLRQQALVDRLLLAVPALGGCLRALALARFCLALRLTHEAGMSAPTALRVSLRATDNAAFAARSDKAVALVKAGEELSVALTSTGLFPDDFRHIVAVAEESGRLTEVLRQQADHYEQEATRRLVLLNVAASFLVWGAIAVVIIIAIFRIALFYISFLDPDNPLYKI
jgi:type IV pilus assembly protein PilC